MRRLSVKRLLVVTYVTFCLTLTLVNYHYSLLTQLTQDLTATLNRDPDRPPQKPGLLYGLVRVASWTRGQAPSGPPKTSPAPHLLPIWPEEENSTDRILEQIDYIPPKTNNTRAKIRIYLPHGYVSWNVPPGGEIFQQEKCQMQNCEFTATSADAIAADAIVFRNTVIEPYSAGLRPPNQIWVLYALESPEHTPRFGDRANGRINWTATYRWNSDLVAPYAKYVAGPPASGRLRPAPANFSSGKSKMVAWFVSNCFTSNDRRGVADKLAKHIQVDVFGACGSPTCSRHRPDCFDRLNKEFRFYLSFENSNCRDYITEKFFNNGLGYNVIPIVLGAPREDYERVSPPHSFIHVEDFNSTADLARYLHYLAKNDTAYNEYLAWKQTGGSFINTKFWCRLCSLLNSVRRTPKIYQDLDTWWRAPGTCIRGEHTWKQRAATSPPK